ncbi:hypothetical protein V2G26_019088 [Clonostachys chloroleuca]
MVRGQPCGLRTALWSQDSPVVPGQLYGPRTAIWSQDSYMVPGQPCGPRTAWSRDSPMVRKQYNHSFQHVRGQLVCTRTASVPMKRRAFYARAAVSGLS